jgi:hypothetical protein
MMSKLFSVLLFSAFTLSGFALLAESKSEFDLKAQVEQYKLRYSLRDPYSKLIDYNGDGFEPLYGVRNFRVVLNGVYYRGGSNNTHNKNLVRGNSNPLEAEALKNLCEEGFSESVYLYATNFTSAPTSVTCRTRDGRPNTLNYRQINALLGNNEHVQLKEIFDHIKGTVPGPIYDHCWNGWHASGYVAAMSMMQFCSYTHAQADAYWVKNTDGNFTKNSGIRAKLRKFKPFDDLKISKEERDLLCL